MNIDFTRPNLFRSIIYFMLLYLAFRYRAIFLMEDVLISETALMPIGKWFAEFLAGYPVFREIVLFLFTLLTAYSIVQVLSRNLVYLERTYIPAMLYPLLALGYQTSAQTPVIMIAAFLIVRAIGNIIKAYKQGGNSGYFLNASLTLGLAPLLYAPAIVFFLLLPIGFILFRQNWRSVLTSLIGYVIPIFFNAYVHWGMGGDYGNINRPLLSGILTPQTESLFIFQMEIWDYILTALFLGLTVWAIINFYGGTTQTRHRAIRGYSVFFWMMFLTLGMISLPCRSLDMLPLLAIPLAALIPACFNRKSGWLPNLLYALMLWSILFYNIYLLFFQLNT